MPTQENHRIQIAHSRAVIPLPFQLASKIELDNRGGAGVVLHLSATDPSQSVGGIAFHSLPARRPRLSVGFTSLVAAIGISPSTPLRSAIPHELKSGGGDAA